MGWVFNVTPRSLCPRERDPVPIVQEAIFKRNKYYISECVFVALLIQQAKGIFSSLVCLAVL